MENIPIMSDFVQYGAVGVALASIIANIFIVKIFVSGFKDVYARFDVRLERLDTTLSELSAEVKSFSRIRSRKREKQQDD